MAAPPGQFGKRRLPPLEPSPPVKRSGHVALLVMGTLAVGGGAYVLMPHDNCDPQQQPPGLAASATPGQLPGTACTSRRSSSSGSHWYGSSSRSSFYGGESSSSHASSSGNPVSALGGGNVVRGGFGSFGHAISAHSGT